MENKIPTAEEFLKDKLSEIHEKEIFEDLLQKMFTVDVSEVMIEFAKLHVEAALNAACESEGYDIDENSILNAYPLTNIK
jgi:hypothetical protein